jgi:CdiI N-terminal domain
VSLPFLVDLTSWRIADYESQWKAAIDRLMRGAPVTALVTCYTNKPSQPQRMWAVWRDGKYAYVQAHVVVPDEQELPFDPFFPEPHVGARLSAESGVPISEWRVEMVQLILDAWGLRFPLNRR